MLQADGKIVVPFGWRKPTGSRAFVVGAPDGTSLGVARFANPSLAPVEEEEEVVVKKDDPKPAATAAVVPASVAAGAPIVARRCLSRRSLTLRLRTGRRKSEQSRIVSTSIT